MSVRIITDSASDLTRPFPPHVTVLPMPITFGERICRDGVDLTHKQFYELLIESDTLPVTSQINPEEFSRAFQAAVKAGDTVVAVLISSKLSGTYQSACIAAADFPGKVFITDSLNATIGEAILVRRAVELAKQRMSAGAIAAQLEAEKGDVRVIGLLGTLEYLRKGGRLSATAALAGAMLSIKPVVAVVDGEVAVLGKARGSRNGNNLLIQETQKTKGIDFSRPYSLGYTGLSCALLEKYVADSEALWKGRTNELPVTTIGATIGAHLGPDAIAVAFFQNPD